MFVCLFKGHLYYNGNSEPNQSFNLYNPLQTVIPETGGIMIKDKYGNMVNSSYRQAADLPLSGYDNESINYLDIRHRLVSGEVEVGSDKTDMNNLFKKLGEAERVAVITEHAFTELNILWRNGERDIHIRNSAEIDPNNPFFYATPMNDEMGHYLTYLYQSGQIFNVKDADKLVLKVANKVNTMVPNKYSKLLKVKLEDCFRLARDTSLSEQGRFEELLKVGEWLYTDEGVFSVEEIPHHK